MAMKASFEKGKDLHRSGDLHHKLETNVETVLGQYASTFVDRPLIFRSSKISVG